MLRSHHQVTIRCGNRVLIFDTPKVMGILNVTPDSFFAPSRVSQATGGFIEKAGRMIDEGASILDIGGVSTRPGAEEISEDEELRRVVPVVEALHNRYPDIILSIDTFRAKVAETCLGIGATIINDISGGRFDNQLLQVVADSQATYVLMHSRGSINNMHQMSEYQNFMDDLIKYFIQQIRSLHNLGIRDILLDPGFGFSKTMEQNFKLMDRLSVLQFLDYPILVGVSRKSSLSALLGRPTEDTLEATTALHMTALLNGASILRVHDVRAAMDTIAVFNKLQSVKTLNNKSLSR